MPVSRVWAENKWILRLDSFFVNSGLNAREEIKSKVRGQYRREGNNKLLSIQKQIF